MSKKYTIYLVDDHAIVRSGLKALIERIGNFTVAKEYDNGRDLVDDHPFSPLPDLIIMDLTMPIMDGAEAMEWLRNHKVPIPVLILTLDTSEQKIIELFRLGVRGYLPKSCTADTLKKAITDVLTSGFYHNELLIKALAAGNEQVAPTHNDILKQITDRELMFIKLVCDPAEFTYDQISSKMGVSRRTVDGYRESLFEKFNIKSKTGLVLFAIKYDIVESL